ncbi:hypothetical protein [Hoeflea sp.]|uniref:hypothetical protein n=1 Tax=Hoeflea sp. TaxID=1940281 RepID=UPI003A913FC9
MQFGFNGGFRKEPANPPLPSGKNGSLASIGFSRTFLQPLPPIRKGQAGTRKPRTNPLRQLAKELADIFEAEGPNAAKPSQVPDPCALSEVLCPLVVACQRDQQCEPANNQRMFPQKLIDHEALPFTGENGMVPVFPANGKIVDLRPQFPGREPETVICIGIHHGHATRRFGCRLVGKHQLEPVGGNLMITGQQHVRFRLRCHGRQQIIHDPVGLIFDFLGFALVECAAKGPCGPALVIMLDLNGAVREQIYLFRLPAKNVVELPEKLQITLVVANDHKLVAVTFNE